MIKCGKTGATLLYGTKCVGCDCYRALREAERLASHVEVVGFDVTSHADQVVKIGRDYRYTIDDIELHEVDPRASERWDEQIRRHRERMEEALRASLFVSDPPWHFNCRSTVNPRWDDGEPFPYDPKVEVITDPADGRGFDARRVGPR